MEQLLRKYTNEHSRFMVINGIMAHYRDEGEGEPILLLHGAFSSLHTFDQWTSHFKKHFRVIRLTMPGFGLTGPCPQGQYNMPAQLTFIKTFLNRLKIDRITLGGSSLGGWVAWEYALENREQVKKLILISAAGFMDEGSIPLPFKMARAPFLNKTFKYVIRRPVLEQFVRQVYADPNLVTADVVDRYYDLLTRKGNMDAFILMANGRVRDNTNHLSKLETPTLILWGKEDRWLPVQNAYRFQSKIRSSHLVVYEQVGHLPMEEIPYRSANDASDFLLQKAV